MPFASLPRVLLLGDIKDADAIAEWEKLASIAKLTKATSKNREEFFQDCQSGEYDGLVTVFRTFNSVAQTGRWDKDLCNKLPKSIKYLCHNGAGYDQIDINACTERGIHVSNVPTAVNNSTADTGVFLLLGALRNFNSSMFTLRRLEWRGAPVPLGRDPEGKTLGIIGMGGIGRNMARKMKGFGLKVQYYNRRELSLDQREGAKYIDFEELLKTSDVISLYLPLNLQTWHTLFTPQFKIMKPGVVVVNTARGAIIDEAALVQALNNGIVGSVGLDVYEEESKIHPGLVNNEKVILLPHMGTASFETRHAMEKWNISSVQMALTEGKLKSPVQEQMDVPFK